MTVTVLPTKYVKSWPDSIDAPEILQVPLEQAFAQHYDTDAHCTQYTSWRPHRLSKRAADSDAAPQCELIILDVDNHRPGITHSELEQWRELERAKVARLEGDYEGIYAYETLGGYRIVGRLPEPFPITSQQAAQDWHRLYSTTRNWLLRAYSIDADDLHDWTRVFRLPNVHREKTGPVTGNVIAGDPASIGVWDYSSELLDEDAPEDKALAHGVSHGHLPGTEFVLWRLCYEDRLFRSDQRADGAWCIQCPLAHEHSHGGAKDSITGTLLYPPEDDKRKFGNILCLHAGQSGHNLLRTPKAWCQRVPGWRERSGIRFQEAPEERQQLDAAEKALMAQLDNELPPEEWAEESIADGNTALKPAPARRAMAVMQRGDDLEVAQFVRLALESDGPVAATAGDFWRWREPVWQRISREVIGQQAHVLANCAVEGAKKGLRITQRVVDGARKRLYDMAFEEEFFSDAANGIAFTNGFLRVTREGAALVPNGPEHRARFAYQFPYDAAARSPTWERCLDDWFGDSEDALQCVEYCQRYLGMCLIGRGTEEQRALVLYGKGGEGKSVFAEAIAASFPDKSVCSVSPYDWGKEPSRAELEGKRLNVVAELPDADLTAGEKFKAIITGDRIGARRLYRDPFDFRPIAGHLLTTNYLPGTRDHSDAFWRRFAVVTFDRAPVEKDPHLPKRLAEEVSGIVAWLVQGALDAMSVGITLPASAEHTVAEWRAGSDPVSTWMTEALEHSHEPTVKAKDLYKEYQAWCSANGHGPVSATKLGRRLVDSGYRKKKTETGISYYVAWLNDYDHCRSFSPFGPAQ